MEHNQNFYCGVVPSLSPKYPWFVAQNLEAKEDDTQTHIFFNLHDPLSHYRCEIPELLGKRIRGCFFGCWALLSSNNPTDVIWSLWNPITSQIINFPPLILRKSEGDHGDIIYCCCLSAPPDHPDSVLLLTRAKKYKFVYCRLGSNSISPNARKRNELRWTEMTYAKQIRGITGFDGSLHSLTCCNGKVYAYIKVFDISRSALLVEVDMTIKYCKRKKVRKVVITLLPILEFPWKPIIDCCSSVILLKGSCTELFTIVLGIKDKTSRTVGAVKVFKLDMSNKKWQEIDDLKDTVLSVEVDTGSLLYSPAIASSEFGGYIHIFGDKGKIIYSYHVKDKTISVYSRPCLTGTNHMSAWTMLKCTGFDDDHAYLKQEQNKDAIVVRSAKCDHEVESRCTKDESHLLKSLFRVLKMIKEFCAGVECVKLNPLLFSGYECRLKSDHGDIKQEEDMDNDILVRSINGDEDESHLSSIPLHVLEVVMEFCVGFEYLKFRSTCQLCHSAAPLIQCNNGKASKQLQTYSLHSPWLMVFDEHKGIITFKDPMFGDNYFIKTPQQLICDFRIECSRCGWLLIIKSDDSMVFFNPFTNDIRELPKLSYEAVFCFSAPPTSPDCMVVALSTIFVFVYFVAGEPCWREIYLDIDHDELCSYHFLTLYGQDLSAISADGGLAVFKQMGGEDYCWERNLSQAPKSCCTTLPESFQVRCDEHVLRVIVGKFGESVEVFKLKGSTQEWVKINGLGKHMIFICSASSPCIEAKIPEMENKIYFPRLSSESGNMVFYSLETCRYHIFDNKVIQEEFADFFGTKHFLTRHTWIEPSWC